MTGRGVVMVGGGEGMTIVFKYARPGAKHQIVTPPNDAAREALMSRLMPAVNAGLADLWCFNDADAAKAFVPDADVWDTDGWMA